MRQHQYPQQYANPRTRQPERSPLDNIQQLLQIYQPFSEDADLQRQMEAQKIAALEQEQMMKSQLHPLQLQMLQQQYDQQPALAEQTRLHAEMQRKAIESEIAYRNFGMGIKPPEVVAAEQAHASGLAVAGDVMAQNRMVDAGALPRNEAPLYGIDPELGAQFHVTSQAPLTKDGRGDANEGKVILALKERFPEAFDAWSKLHPDASGAANIHAAEYLKTFEPGALQQFAHPETPEMADRRQQLELMQRIYGEHFPASFGTHSMDYSAEQRAAAEALRARSIYGGVPGRFGGY